MSGRLKWVFAGTGKRYQGVPGGPWYSRSMGSGWPDMRSFGSQFGSPDLQPDTL
jgi:hypothetical protein